MTTDNKTRYIPVTEWEQHHSWPTAAGLRYLIFNRKRNGFDKVAVKSGGRVLINEAEFMKWVEARNKFNFEFKRSK
jgi:hypothetical protein